MGKHGIKDPKKVRAGRLGGKVSGGNFKNNRDRAVMAGQTSAWRRGEQKLEDFPIPMVTLEGKLTPFDDPEAAATSHRRIGRRAR